MTNEQRKAVSSAPCERDDAETQSRGYAGRKEILALCNELLAAERAGARATWRLRDDTRNAELARLMNRVHEDERASCRLLLEAIERLDGEALPGVGDFEGKVMALTNEAERIALLNRGQTWVVRRLEALLPRIEDAGVAACLQEMLQLHQQNIAAAAQWLDAES